MKGSWLLSSTIGCYAAPHSIFFENPGCRYERDTRGSLLLRWLHSILTAYVRFAFEVFTGIFTLWSFYRTAGSVYSSNQKLATLQPQMQLSFLLACSVDGLWIFQMVNYCAFWHWDVFAWSTRLSSNSYFGPHLCLAGRFYLYFLIADCPKDFFWQFSSECFWKDGINFSIW